MKKNSFMKKLSLIAVLLTFLAASCQMKQSSTSKSTTETAVTDGHHAQNSLDWPGIYTGTLPCADCEGIETHLSLTPDGTYTLTTTYLGKDENKFEQKGTFSWNEAGNTVLLDGIEDGSSQYFVGENYLLHLDMEGNKIIGELAHMYRLTKNTGNVVPNENQLTGVKWKLIEIYGQTFEAVEGQNVEAFLVFDEKENRIYGSGSCNNFNGSYELKEGQRITLTGLATTMMACPNMKIEQELFEALNSCDNYTIHQGVLSLNKARMAPMAKFTAVELEK